jgi:uncharacterized membrane protein
VLWPGQDAAILAIVVFVSLTALISVRILRRPGQQSGAVRVPAGGAITAN